MFETVSTTGDALVFSTGVLYIDLFQEAEFKLVGWSKTNIGFYIYI